MYSRFLHKQRQIRRFTIRYRPSRGWEVVDQIDTTVLRRTIYDDWHRVERAIEMFQREEAALREDGWVRAS